MYNCIVFVVPDHDTTCKPYKRQKIVIPLGVPKDVSDSVVAFKQYVYDECNIAVTWYGVTSHFQFCTCDSEALSLSCTLTEKVAEVRVAGWNTTRFQESVGFEVCSPFVFTFILTFTR